MSEEISLSFQNLTVRFGGLTAVDDFCCEVESGKVFSIIGPNGAGKTTAFNAATGIYQPTAGRVVVRGHEPSRPLTRRVLLLCSLVGLTMGLTSFLLTHNVDKLWKATIKRNMVDGGQSFSYLDAAQDGLAYLRGELALELRRGKWRVVTADGETELRRISVPAGPPQEKQFLTATTRRQADRLRRDLEEIIALGGSERTLSEQAGSWTIRSSDTERVLAKHSTRERAILELKTCAEIGSARRVRGVVAWILGAIGCILGAAGTFSVWAQSRRSPDVIMRGGIARTFQNIRLFPDMTVLENVLVGMERRFAASALAMMIRTPGVCRAEEKAYGRAMVLLGWVGLQKNWNVLAKNLPYGEQRRLEIARALAAKPRILLLDEPAAGMNHAEANELMALIREIKRQRLTILLIEHDIPFVMQISDRIAVMNYGVKIADGTPDEVRNDPQVIEAYLGREDVESSEQDAEDAE